jgi:hypothetical protein
MDVFFAPQINQNSSNFWRICLPFAARGVGERNVVELCSYLAYGSNDLLRRTFMLLLNIPRLPRLNLFCMGCQRRVALPTQTKIILELSIIVALIVNNCL